MLFKQQLALRRIYDPPKILALSHFRISRFATINRLDSHDADIGSWNTDEIYTLLEISA